MSGRSLRQRGDTNQPLFRYELGYVSIQSSAEAEERGQLVLVKAYHRLSVNQSDRGGHQTARLQLLQCILVCADIALPELDPLRRKNSFVLLQIQPG